jgi:integrase
MTDKRKVSANTQSVALNAIAFLYREVLKNAIAFLYREVLKMEMPCLEKLRRIKRYKPIPVVMSQREVEQTLVNMSGTTRLKAELMYGAGLRIGECVTLRVKDIDFDLRSITVRAGKGHKDRTTLLPHALIPDLRNHLLKVYELHKSDVLHGNGYAPMPNALYKKYPSASRLISACASGVYETNVDVDYQTLVELLLQSTS